MTDYEKDQIDYCRSGHDLCFCDAYLDQGCYIGEDPVGCACNSPATKRIRMILETEPYEFDVCDRCYALLMSPDRRERDRVTLAGMGDDHCFRCVMPIDITRMKV